jgi:hypothetical protein
VDYRFTRLRLYLVHCVCGLSLLCQYHLHGTIFRLLKCVSEPLSKNNSSTILSSSILFLIVPIPKLPYTCNRTDRDLRNELFARLSKMLQWTLWCNKALPLLSVYQIASQVTEKMFIIES